MVVALWIIAACEIIRAAQNMIQIMMIRSDKSQRENCYAEFIQSMKQDDRQFVKRLLEEFEKEEYERE